MMQSLEPGLASFRSFEKVFASFIAIFGCFGCLGLNLGWSLVLVGLLTQKLRVVQWCLCFRYLVISLLKIKLIIDKSNIKIFIKQVKN